MDSLTFNVRAAGAWYNAASAVATVPLSNVIGARDNPHAMAIGPRWFGDDDWCDTALVLYHVATGAIISISPKGDRTRLMTLASTLATMEGIDWKTDNPARVFKDRRAETRVAMTVRRSRDGERGPCLSRGKVSV